MYDRQTRIQFHALDAIVTCVHKEQVISKNGPADSKCKDKGNCITKDDTILYYDDVVVAYILRQTQPIHQSFVSSAVEARHQFHGL